MESRTTSVDGNDPAVAFFDAVANAGLTTIQFKSTRTLDRAFAAAEDFDLLVRREDFDRVLRVAEELGFRRRWTTDPFHPSAIVDLLHWDPGMSRLHHLSLHRELVFGERPIKRHVVPWTSIEQVSTVAHRPGLRVLDPPAELALLIARIVLRATSPGRLRSPWRRIEVPVDVRMRDEVLALDPNVSDDALRRAAAVLLPNAGDLLVEVRRGITDPAENGHGQPSEGDRRALVAALKPLAVRSRTAAFLARLRHRNARPTRNVGTGAVIAVVGADGAGKSTVTAHVHDVLGTKLTVRRIYLGLPRGSRPITFVALLGAIAHRLRLTRPARLLGDARAILVGRERRRTLVRARREAARGIISIADRYPLAELHGLEPPMDGPRLGGRGLLGRLERRQYANMGRPDVLIALVADPDLLIARKPGDERPDLVRAKAGAVQVLAQTHPDVIGVDASLPLQSVIQKVTTAVWLHVSRESP